MVGEKDTGGPAASPPSKTKLKRVFSMSGEYGLRNHTIKDIRDLKGKRQLSQTMPFTPQEAKAAEAAGIDIVNIRYNPDAPEQARAIRQAAPHTFAMFAMPLTKVTSEREALRMAFDAMESGADSIMCQWSLRFTKAVAETGIPIQGHVGLVPRKSTWTGGLRAVGKTLEEALAIHKDIKDLEATGAWAVECEVIPSDIMRELSKRTKLVTISIGSGNGGDVQFLFAEDILGDREPPFPRHSKQYCNLQKIRDQMQTMRVNAFSEFVSDVQSGSFPSKDYEVGVERAVVDAFIKEIED